MIDNKNELFNNDLNDYVTSELFLSLIPFSIGSIMIIQLFTILKEVNNDIYLFEQVFLSKGTTRMSVSIVLIVNKTYEFFSKISLERICLWNLRSVIINITEYVISYC